VIYIDSSVLLSHLLAEDRRPAESLWREDLISSRLLEYEVWNRIHARGLATLASAAVTKALSNIYLLALSPVVLRKALEPLPVRLRTLDTLHLATMEYLLRSGRSIKLASYDHRMLAAAAATGIEAAPL
jgi:predicted nucleic acid-binding protein